MSSIREAIASVRATHRLLSGDAQLNDRSILKELRDTATMLITRATDRRKLFASPNIFTPLPCLRMEEVPLSVCCEYTDPVWVARSVEQLPKIAEGLYGLLIQSVSSLNNRLFFKESTPRRYANILRMKIPHRDVFYWVYNAHLYVTNSDTRAVNLSAYFEEDVPTTLLFPGEDCDCQQKPLLENICINPLDLPYRVPGYMEDQVKSIVSARLLQTYFKLPADRSEDGVDEQTVDR